LTVKGGATRSYGFKSTVIVKNFGQSPAYKVYVRRKERTVGLAIAEVTDFDAALADAPRFGGGTVGPTDGLSYEIDNILKPEEHASLLRRTTNAFIIGDITFTDVFGETWVSEYCLRVEGYGSDKIRVFPFGSRNATMRESERNQ
jgi:hypothetical protein